MDLKSQVEEAFLYLVNCYNWFRPADEEIAIAVWCDVLEGLPPKSIYPAVKHWCRTNSKEPTAADIRAIIEQSANRKRNPVAAVAWDELVRAAEEGLSFERVEQRFRKYPRVIAAVRSIGWERVRYADLLTELPFVRRDFLAAYKEISEDAEQYRRFSAAEKQIFGDVRKALEHKKEPVQ